MTTPSNLSQEWEDTRRRFMQSLMIGTRLSSLAENADLPSWPLSGNDETPEKYLDLSWDEIQLIPDLIKEDHQLLKHLLRILKATLAFDDPFSEMAATAEAESEKEDTLIKVLNRLHISPDYPIALTQLSPETREFCNTQGFTKIGEFIAFAQNIAQNIVIKGDYRSFLNALANADERGIARHLPYRPGSKGLHLAEAIGLLMDAYTQEEKNALLQRHGYKPAPTPPATLSNSQIAALENRTCERLGTLLDYFTEETLELRTLLAQKQAIERFFLPLNNPEKEFLAARLLTSLTDKPAKTPTQTNLQSEETPTTKKGGFLSRLGRLFGSKD